MNRVLLLALACAVCLPGTEYRQRRETLRKVLDNAVLVLFGEAGESLRSGFIQEPSFYYLTGWQEPGAILLMDAKSELLLLPEHDEKRERFSGRMWAAGDAGVQERTGFLAVLPVQSLESQLFRMLETSGKVYTLEGRPSAAKLKSLLAMRTVSDAGSLLAPLRMRKSAAEIRAIEHAVGVSVEAQQEAWKRIRPGVFEYQVAATLTSAWMERGCERPAYQPIVGSGPNGAVLHYFRNNRRMDAGEVVVIDAAAECGMYAADLTRTLPVNGRFTARQRELYELVLGAQKAVIQAVKPGMTLGKTSPDSLYKVAIEYLNSHGKPAGGKPLGDFMTHGVGHHIGLEVHDLEAQDAKLAEGMVITVEPGVYIPDEGIGIRIEDVVAVTAQGSRVLSGGLVKEAAEIERAMARNSR
jgi:Xaa-Pro aminopeptidase